MRVPLVAQFGGPQDGMPDHGTPERSSKPAQLNELATAIVAEAIDEAELEKKPAAVELGHGLATRRAGLGRLGGSVGSLGLRFRGRCWRAGSARLRPVLAPQRLQ